MSDETWWYATRAAGLMTWATAVAAIVIGLLLSTRLVKRRTGPWLNDLHRFLGGLSAFFLVVHLVTLVGDSSESFGWRELAIPGESTWNTEAATWGIIAAYSLIAVELTSLLRRWISDTFWRMFHMLSIVTAGAGTYHAFLGGSDVDNALTWLIAGFGSVVAILLVGIRLRREGNRDLHTADRSTREQLLREMRDRLESLPVPESTTRPELAFEETEALPRRSPTRRVSDEPVPAGATVGTLVPSVTNHDHSPVEHAFSDDPFAAIPRRDDTDPAVAGQPTGSRLPPPPAAYEGPSRDDPFATPIPPSPASSAPMTPPTEADPFGRSAGDTGPGPFGDTGPHPAPVSMPELFAPPSAEEAAAENATVIDDGGFPELPPLNSSPFRAVEPTTHSIAVEVDEHGTAAPGPPPLPDDAVDPETGQPDEAAYTAWLVEWLAYAEQYGEATPEDPNRI